MASNSPTLAEDEDDLISFKMVQAMNSLRVNREFFDCRVAVDGETFDCHSFVLWSCSEFFRCIFKHSMIDKDMPIRLNKLSASTFRLILDTLYTGENLLTAFNIIDMWQGANQLRIGFLIKLCKDFVMKHFSALINTQEFLNLNMEDLKQFVVNDDLVVESEDIVLQAIFGWVRSNEKERKKYLAHLIQCTRYYLASKACIEILTKDPFSQNDSRIKEMFERATVSCVDFMCGFWPTAAIHRKCMGYENVGVYCNIDDMNFVHLSLQQNTVIDFKDIPDLKAMTLAVANNKLFACKEIRGEIKVLALENQHWVLVGSFRRTNRKHYLLVMVIFNGYIYVLYGDKMHIFDPNNKDITFQENLYDLAYPQHAISFRSQILLFRSENNNEAEVTTVHSWRSETKTWSHLVNLQFSAMDMTSFNDESNWYTLDRNGHFWKLTNSDTVVFTYIGKLWDVPLKMKGALIFRKTLCLFVERLESAITLNFNNDLGSGIFQNVKIQYTNVRTSNVVHLVKSK